MEFGKVVRGTIDGLMFTLFIHYRWYSENCWSLFHYERGSMHKQAGAVSFPVLLKGLENPVAGTAFRTIQNTTW